MCTFEAKSLNFAAASTAIIVVNDEDMQRFIMAGENDAAAKPRSLAPTVMVSQDDGKKLSRLAAKSVRATVSLTPQINTGIFSESEGDDVKLGNIVPFPEDPESEDGPSSNLRWPVVQTEADAVQVLSKDRTWGVRLVREQTKKGKGGEGSWNLYILNLQ